MVLKRTILVGLTVLALIILSTCTPTTNIVLTPSKLFYINDQDRVLLNATSWSIFTYGEELYEDSKASDIPNIIRGSQVVVLTYLGDSSQINSTEIFNNWGIGENDMGILIILFFTQAEDSYTYDSMLFEIGSQMSTFLSAFAANDLITLYFDDPSIPSFDYDARLMNLYYGVLSYIYLNVYDYNSYNHQSYMNAYYDIQYEYINPLPGNVELPFYTSPIFWIIVVSTILFGGSLFSFIPFVFISSGKVIKGGGGKSFGYWFKR